MLQVHLKARFILNGVCVIWKGWIDCNRLDGTGCLEFDEEKSLMEESKERERQEKIALQIQEFNQQHRLYSDQERQAEESENLRRMRRNGGIKLEQPL
ncbi:CBFB [Bugula neritina]|uniref:CBFB n=1 Tax=Bugula neritina TaxID=10212 RepID=A0A7J7JR71_BUGNE|nr:CBFB [Bugula neritina]